MSKISQKQSQLPCKLGWRTGTPRGKLLVKQQNYSQKITEFSWNRTIFRGSSWVILGKSQNSRETGIIFRGTGRAVRRRSRNSRDTDIILFSAELAKSFAGNHEIPPCITFRGNSRPSWDKAYWFSEQWYYLRKQTIVLTKNEAEFARSSQILLKPLKNVVWTRPNAGRPAKTTIPSPNLTGSYPGVPE